MKIAVGSFTHESNTFTPLIASEGDFQVFRGQEIYENLDFYGPVKGIISTFLKYKNYYVEPTIFAHGVPFGEVEKEFYLKIKNELLERIKNVADLTAVVLALHGSMRVKVIGDAEGDLLLHLRRIVPKSIPIICSLYSLFFCQKFQPIKNKITGIIINNDILNIFNISSKK